MNRKIGHVVDFIFLLSLLMFFYFHAFNKEQAGTNWRIADFVLALLAIIVLPFRVKAHPRLSNYVLYDGKGERRKTLIIPLASMLLVLFGFIVAARIAFRLFEMTGVGR